MIISNILTTTMKNNKENNKKTQTNNNVTMVMINSTTAEAAVMVDKLYKFFNERDESETYLQDTEKTFSKLTNAVQGMIGCEAYWNIVSRRVE